MSILAENLQNRNRQMNMKLMGNLQTTDVSITFWIFSFIPLNKWITFLLKYSCCTVLCKLEFYNIMIYNFKGYNPFGLIIKYGCIPCVVHYILVVYFISNSLHLLILYPHVAPPQFSLPTGNHQSVLFICESTSFVTLTSLLYFLDPTYKWYRTVFVFLCLTFQ